MDTVTISAAESSLPQLLARVEAGEEIIVIRGDKPIARIVPIPQPTGKRQIGAMKGLATVGPEFFEPLPEEELKLWE